MNNLLPLETWRQYFGYQPFHFWGLTNAKTPITSACNSLVYKYTWQGSKDAVGRNEILQAIEAAETRLQEYLGYSIAPHYVEKTVQFPHYFNPLQWRSNGSMLPVSVQEGFIQAVGIESLTSLGNTALAISDTDGDGLTDTFTVTIATTETDPNKIGIYFISTDRLDSEPLNEKWRIQPVSVTIAAGIATIRGRWWLLVKPILYEGVVADTASGKNPDTNTNFVTQVEVAIRSTNPNGQTLTDAQAVLLWESIPCDGWWGCCTNTSPTNSNDPAAVGMAIARVGIRDARLGELLPAQSAYDSVAAQWRAVEWSGFREPDRVTLRYLAGWPLGSDGNVDRKWQVIVARMAAAELARPICACDVANQELFHWQFDVSRAGGANSEQYSISPADLDNPFGTRRGQVWAWKQVKNLRFGGGTRVG